MRYKALLVTETTDNQFIREIKTIDTSFLPNNEVLIEVKYAALNYKDALSAGGHKGITRSYPHTPGVDAAGIVVSDSSGTFSVGLEVVVTGYDLGMNTAGGFGNYIKVPAAWVVPLPSGLNLKQAMIIGTGGFTAALALYKMELNLQSPSLGPILVTGATGGVGSLAVAICHKAGYEVIASTGKESAYEYLTKIGASKIVNREAVNIVSEKPVYKPLFAGAIDTVGGNTLATLLKSCMPKGNIATTGLVDSPFFSINVYPFIIRGNSLLGIDSAETPMEIRLKIWHLLANEWNVLPLLDDIAYEIALEDILGQMDLILKGQTKGRVIVKY